MLCIPVLLKARIIPALSLLKGLISSGRRAASDIRYAGHNPLYTLESDSRVAIETSNANAIRSMLQIEMFLSPRSTELM